MEKMENLEMKMLVRFLHLPREEPLLVCAFVLAASCLVVYGDVLTNVAAFLLSVTCPPPLSLSPTSDHRRGEAHANCWCRYLRVINLL